MKHKKEWHLVERIGHVNRAKKQTYDVMAGPAGQPENWDMVCDKATKEDGALITSAPDLLKACETALDTMMWALEQKHPEPGSCDPCVMACQDLQEELIAAIRSAQPKP